MYPNCNLNTNHTGALTYMASFLALNKWVQVSHMFPILYNIITNDSAYQFKVLVLVINLNIYTF